MTKPVCSDCGKPVVGVVPGLVAHFYVCKDHAEKAEKNGWYVAHQFKNSIYATIGDWSTGNVAKYSNGGDVDKAALDR